MERAHEALNRLMEAIAYHAPPDLVWQAEAWARVVREALRQGEEALRSLEAAQARERHYRAVEERMRHALALIELEARRGRGEG
ncbi:hypothetical protein CSW50_12155 [Thermus scotoductus]|uniref:Uncharacterized protein n=1 Tax=Thermus scotoductus TaxID=37636 RepID=A0A430QX20_THESC|nr:hypothetical protein [Thermus scotoductus]RTG99684.1 hypothetical protein CSW50_12155 [Thermus scotoductus]